MFTIYSLKNTQNNKVYIGSTTKSLERRVSKHFYEAGSSTRPIHEAIEEFGSEVFEYRAIEEVEGEVEAGEAERYWIEAHNAVEEGYNAALSSARGRTGEDNGNTKVSDETAYKAITIALTTDKTLVEIAQEIGTTQGTLSKWISGQSRQYLIEKFNS